MPVPPSDPTPHRLGLLHGVPAWLPAGMAGGLALLLRVLYVLDMRVHNVLFDAPIMDGAVHDGWARGTIDLFYAHIPYFRAPLYPWFLQGIVALNDGYLLPRLVQAVCAALTVALVADIARRLAGPLAGLAAGILLAIHWPSIYFTGELLIVTPFVLLVMIALWAFTRAGLEDQPRWAWVGAAALGVSSIARPTSLSFLPVLLLLPLWLWPRHGLSRLTRARWTLAAGLLLVALAPGLALTVRNKIVGDDWVFIASQGGVNFYIGNNPHSDGRTAVVPGTRSTWLGGYQDTIAQAQADEGRPLKPSEVSRHYFGKGLRFWASDPAGALRLYARKLRLLLGAGERSNNQNIHFWRHQSPLLRGAWGVSWATMLSLGLVGLWLLPSRWRAAPIVGFLATYALGLLLFFVNERFRTPLVPALAVFAGVAVSAAVEAVRGRAWPRLAVVLVGVAVIYGLSSLDRLDFRENRIDADAFSRYTMANAYLKKGEPARAQAAYEDALRVAHSFNLKGFDQIEPMLQVNLARSLLGQLKLEEMQEQLKVLQASMGEAPEVRLLWAEFYMAQHDYRRAFSRFRDLSREFPDQWEALLGLGWCQVYNKAYQTALGTFDRVLQLHPGDARALAGKGAAEMLGKDNYEVARGLFERALRIDPNVAEAHHFLGEYYFRYVKDPAKMVLHLREALRLDPYNNDVRRFLIRNKIPFDTPMPSGVGS